MISIILLLFVGVYSHSWVECTDYKGDLSNYEKDKCNHLPRPLSQNRNVGNLFGQDIGMDYRPKSNARCQGDPSLSQGKKLVRYEVGKTYTIAWPAKNHAAASCTNANIPDTFLKLYMAPWNGVTDPDQDTFKKNEVDSSFSKDPHQRGAIDMKGFQNCPNFCNNGTGGTDKALCTGTFTVNPNTKPGKYTFQWYWAFNSENDLYATCWEAELVSKQNPIPISSTTSTTIDPNSCLAGIIKAPIGDSIQPIQVKYSTFTKGTKQIVQCPIGFNTKNKSFEILCLATNITPSVVNGFCFPNASTPATDIIFSLSDNISNINLEDANIDTDARLTANVLGVLLSLIILSFIGYCYFNNFNCQRTKYVAEFSNSINNTKSNKDVTINIDVPKLPLENSDNTKRNLFQGSNWAKKSVKKPVAKPNNDKPRWYYVDNGTTEGPITENQLAQWWKKNNYNDTDVWDGEVAKDWTLLSELLVLSRQLKQIAGESFRM